jgi:hypothetical protein
MKIVTHFTILHTGLKNSMPKDEGFLFTCFVSCSISFLLFFPLSPSLITTNPLEAQQMQHLL